MDEMQASFFDRVYPTISYRLNELEKELENQKENCHYRMVDLKSQIKIMGLTVEQYKKKIQKIEQILIKKGLDAVLKGINDE